MKTADVIVVGGGVIGGAVAWSLAREGLGVALLERDGLAARASGAAAGMLIPVGEGAAHEPLLRWGLRSLALFPEIAAELRERAGVDPEYEASGALYLAATPDEARTWQERTEALPGLGLEWLDAAALAYAEPQLGGRRQRRPPRSEAQPSEVHELCQGLRGALWSPREAHLRSALLARGYAALAQQLGARVETGVPVTGLRRRGARIAGVRTPVGDWDAPSVVLCTGAWTPACAAWLGPAPPLPIEPVRGQVVALDAPHPPLRSIAVAASCYLVPKRDASIVVGATEERAGFDCRVTAAGVAGLLGAAARLVPALGDAAFRSAWAGLRPVTPDGLPLIGPLPGVEGLLVAAGHTRNGVLLSPITGRLVADRILGKELPADAAVFSPGRFAADSPCRSSV